MLACRVLKEIEDRGGKYSVAHIEIGRAKMIFSFKIILCHNILPLWCCEFENGECGIVHKKPFATFLQGFEWYNFLKQQYVCRGKYGGYKIGYDINGIVVDQPYAAHVSCFLVAVKRFFGVFAANCALVFRLNERAENAVDDYTEHRNDEYSDSCFN